MARRRQPAGVDKPAASKARGNEAAPPPLVRVPLALARHFMQICTAAADETVTREGMKTGQFAILAHLGREPGLDQNGIAARMGVERARVSQLADELEVMGLIDRRVNGSDRRARMLRLTSRGEEMRARLQPLARAAQMRVVEPLSPRERELLFDLLVRVIRANRAQVHSGSARKQKAGRSTRNIDGRSSASNRA
jgi:DNA-binding MarR family transcriptional regulator